jgi:hypothetical protein
MTNPSSDARPAMPAREILIRIQTELHQVRALLSGARLMAQKVDERGDEDDFSVLPWEIGLLTEHARDSLSEIIERIERETGHA